MLTVLRRVEPEEHIDRWYMVLVQPTLLDPIAVYCAWGSNDSEWQRSRTIPAADMDAAAFLAARVVAQKVKRGYEIAFQEVDLQSP